MTECTFPWKGLENMQPDRSAWLRIVGGGCFINVAATGFLVGLFSVLPAFNVDSVAIPFLAGATLSLAASFYLLRQIGDEMPVMRKLLLAVMGVLLGSILAVFGIAAYLLLAGSF